MAHKTATYDCRLCGGESPARFTSLPKRLSRTFFHCGTCDLAFADPSHYPTEDEELARYKEHNNDPKDSRYAQFLDRLARPLGAKLPEASRGLDFGCGPTPLLAELLTSQGHRMAVYDPYFFPSEGVLWEPYDFVVCTEVAEHFHDPKKEFAKLKDLVKPGGWLGLMTSFRKEWNAFPGWHYHRDPTHVAFYSESTLQWLADQWGWLLEIPESGVALLRRPA